MRLFCLALRCNLNTSRIAAKFDNLVLNTDKKQIDGKVESVYDEKTSSIVDIKEIKLSFSLSENVKTSYDSVNKKLIFENENENYSVNLPENAKFPLILTDEKGEKFEVNVQEEVVEVIPYMARREPSDTLRKAAPNNVKTAYKHAEMAPEAAKNLIDNTSIEKYKFEDNNAEHLATANIINKYLIEYAEKFGNENLPQNIEIQTNTASKSGFHAEIKRKDNTIIFYSFILTEKTEYWHRHIIYHELAHLHHLKNYPLSFDSCKEVLKEYYKYIFDAVSNYPEQLKKSSYNSPENKNLSIDKKNCNSEKSYNRESYAEIYSKIQEGYEFSDCFEINDKIKELEGKTKLSKKQESELQRIKQQREDFLIKMYQILDLIKNNN